MEVEDLAKPQELFTKNCINLSFLIFVVMATVACAVLQVATPDPDSSQAGGSEDEASETRIEPTLTPMVASDKTIFEPPPDESDGTVEQPAGTGLQDLRTADEAQDLIAAFLQDQVICSPSKV